MAGHARLRAARREVSVDRRRGPASRGRAADRRDDPGPLNVEDVTDDGRRALVSRRSSSDIRRVLSLSAVPWLVVTYDNLRRLPLDTRTGFVVSLIDGRCTVEMLLDVSGMPEDETLDILRELVGLGAVELRDG